MTELVSATYDPANNMVHFSAPIPLPRRGGRGPFLPCGFDVFAHRRKRANAACEQIFVMGGTYDRHTRLLWTGAIEELVQTPTALAGFTGHLVVTIFYRD